MMSAFLWVMFVLLRSTWVSAVDSDMMCIMCGIAVSPRGFLLRLIIANALWRYVFKVKMWWRDFMK